ncbi:MAG TPA: FixH family protein [Gemmatimonadaceae bacterium]|nr:FixH family protein [Gemmatimonadaceae bacterium]
MYSTRTLSVTSRALRAATILSLSAALGGCMMFARPPRELDYGRTRASERGLYRATIRPQGDSVPQGRLHSWMLHLETTGGAPVDLADVAVDGGMPQHGHGLPTRPRITRHLGGGDHLVEGMKFNMGGWWVVKFGVRSDAGSDTLVFNLKL